jgi:hypothetical protein
MEAKIKSGENPECDECQDALKELANIRNVETAMLAELAASNKRMQKLHAEAINDKREFKATETRYIFDMERRLTQFDTTSPTLDDLGKVGISASESD